MSTSKIYGVLLFKNDKTDEHYNFSSIPWSLRLFTSSMRELTLFTCKIIKDRIEPMKFYQINGEEYMNDTMCNCIKYSDDLTIALITNHSFDKYHAMKLIQMINNNQELLKEKDFFDKYIIAENVDKIKKIQKQIDDVKIVMQQNIEAVLNRGEKIDDLVVKSAELSKSAIEFRYNAKKLGKCCWIF